MAEKSILKELTMDQKKELLFDVGLLCKCVAKRLCLWCSVLPRNLPLPICFEDSKINANDAEKYHLEGPNSISAFKRTLAKFEEPGVKLVLITEAYYELALTFARDYFMTEEPLNKALGMQWSDELKEFWMNSFKLNLSLMFLIEQDGAPIALRTTRIARYDDKLNIKAVKDERIKLMVQFLVHGDKEANYFEHFPTKEAFHFLGLGVAPKYKQCGYAAKIFNVAVDMIRNFGINPVYLKVEGTSNFSKRVFEKAGCEMLFEQRFDT